MPLIPFANSNMVIGAISKSMNQTSDTNVMYQNNDSRNNYYEAQKRADMYMKVKDRRPMVFEYLQSAPDNWVSITMYINPDKLSISQQKIKGKQVTRGGIFYHHWGDDHPAMSLSGTTGLSGMKGIEVLEKIYHASGTLLRYQQYGPSTYVSKNLSTIDNGVMVVDVNSPVDVMNAAADSKSKTYVNNLKDIVSKDNKIVDAWKKYKQNKKIVESSTRSNSEMKRLNARNTDLRAQYGFPNGKGEDLGTIEELSSMPQEYSQLWDVYIDGKTRAQALIDAGATLSNSDDLRGLHNILKGMRQDWRLEPDVEYGTYDLTQLPLEKLRWVTAAKEYIDNKKAWVRQLGSITDATTGSKINLEDLTKENQAIRDMYGFPDGTYDEVSKMSSPITNNTIGDIKVLTAKLLSHYQGILNAKDFLKSIDNVDAKLKRYVDNSSTKPSLKDYSNFALTEFRKIQGLDNAIITQLAYQRTVYYDHGSDSPDSPIPYTQDVVGQLSSIYADRSAALNEVMQQMAEFEQQEKSFREDLRDKSMDDIMDDIKDEWKPRRIFIYYENRVYVGHFDAFSYSRDAVNPLLIRYDMRLTIEKQVIGSSQG